MRCSSLTKVTFAIGLTSIGYAAFQFCTNLPSVTLPASVTNIGVQAFYDCYNLTSVYFEGNAPAVGGSAFFGGTVTVYYLPCTTGWGDFSANNSVPAFPWWQALLS